MYFWGLLADKTGLVRKQYQNLAVLVYRLVCQPVTLESWVRFPDAAAKATPSEAGWSPFLLGLTIFCATVYVFHHTDTHI
jgi:hypothetical protein